VGPTQIKARRHSARIPKKFRGCMTRCRFEEQEDSEEVAGGMGSESTSRPGVRTCCSCSATLSAHGTVSQRLHAANYGVPCDHLGSGCSVIVFSCMLAAVIFLVLQMSQSTRRIAAFAYGLSMYRRIACIWLLCSFVMSPPSGGPPCMAT